MPVSVGEIIIMIILGIMALLAIADLVLQEKTRKLLQSHISKSETNNKSPQSISTYTNAAVATDAGPCSTIGKDLLKKGGSAVDAAIGAALCVSVLNAHSNSIGGGSFISIYDASTGDAVYIDARDVAPAKANETMYDGKEDESKRIGALSVAVPGEIAGYWEAYKNYSNKKLEWKELFQPTIDLALNYPEVTRALGFALTTSEVNTSLYNRSFNLESIFVDENEQVKVESDTVSRAELGTTLRHIAKNGSYEFYEGAVAKQIVQDLMDAPGESIITEEDLKNYKVEVKSMIEIELGDLTVLTPGAPSGGPVLAYILNILKGYNFTPEDLEDTEARVLAYHRILEAFKFAYAKRSYLGDPKFDKSDVVGKAVEDMTNETYAEETRLRINDSYTQSREYYGPADFIPPEDSGTTHISVLGKDGSAVAITSSMNLYLGSKVRGLRTGIIFNNNMDDFNNPYNMSNMSKNFIEGGKRPLSSMTPTIIIKRNEIRNKAVQMIVGAAGGIKIPTATAWTIMQMLWFGKTLDEAVKAPRLHHQLDKEYPERAYREKGKFLDEKEGLEEKGHDMTEYEPSESVVQGIRRLDSKIEAKSDDRKGGYPDGY